MNSARRNEILLAINELAATETEVENCGDKLLEKCCKIIMQNQEYCLIWAGKLDEERTGITPIIALTSANIPEKDCMYLLEQILTEMDDSNPAAMAIRTGSHVVIRDVQKSSHYALLGDISKKTGFRSCSSWPLKYKNSQFGVINIHSEKVACFSEEETSFLQTVIADISLALYTREMTQRIQVERDFNREMVNTMEALLISISPCGKILSFNQKAEEVTGYTEEEVRDHYWVDVLMAEEHRRENQQRMSRVLKGEKAQMNFESCLRTKNQQDRIINWHASFRQNLNKGKLGLVLFGIDITGQLQVDHDLKQAISQWENIFAAIQDPALIVSSDSRILDANPATFTAARKTRTEVIGHKICDILHLGRAEGAPCPLEQFILLGQSRIIETELRGLHGYYLLTISPLHMGDDCPEAALLVARDLTEEEQMKAEAMHAAQLASIGELAAGVAHEINNPINGIINYAQIILDSPGDPETPDLLTRIKKEGKRIASIVSNLLDFSRRREESPEIVTVQSIIHKCLELVNHRFKNDRIILKLHLPDSLPPLFCNSQQIQQVILNILSNARYALNARFPHPDPLKQLNIKAETVNHGSEPFVRITITDNGTGIEQDLIDRVFDPFYSSKPKGEGTGLGLSISHGLIHDNNGYLGIRSELGTSTSLRVDLPIPSDLRSTL